MYAFSNINLRKGVVSMLFGYARVSTADQNPQRQVTKFTELGVPQANIYIDFASGRDLNRSNYQLLRGKLRQGDLVYLDSLDRLGRNYEAMIDEWRYITKELGADLVVLENESIFDSRRFREMGDLGSLLETQFLSILSYFADSERKRLLERQKEGVTEARKAGVRFGRPFAKLSKNCEQLFSRCATGELSLTKAANLAGMPKSTFRKYYLQYRSKAR